jgi:hypothetical protein
VKHGFTQSQLLSASHLIEIFKSSQDNFSCDLQVPVTLRETYLYQLVNILNIEVYIEDNNLLYVVKVPLATHYVFDVYTGFQFSMKVKDTIKEFEFIQPEKE